MMNLLGLFKPIVDSFSSFYVVYDKLGVSGSEIEKKISTTSEFWFDIL